MCLRVCLREKWMPFPTIRKWNYVAQDMRNNSKTNSKFKEPITRGQLSSELRFQFSSFNSRDSWKHPTTPPPTLQIYANG